MFPVPPLRKIMSVWIVPCGVEISRGNSVAPRDVLGLPRPQKISATEARLSQKITFINLLYNALWVPLTVEKEPPCAPQLSVSVVEAGELNPRPKTFRFWPLHA